jgi:hypothetical protein
MALFLVEHVHTDETCPSRTVEGVKMMGELVLGPDHARRTGVRFLNDFVVRGKHRLLLFIEADSAENAENYAKPFRMVGKTDVQPLTKCDAIIQEVTTAQKGNQQITATGCG